MTLTEHNKKILAFALTLLIANLDENKADLKDKLGTAPSASELENLLDDMDWLPKSVWPPRSTMR